MVRFRFFNVTVGIITESEELVLQILSKGLSLGAVHSGAPNPCSMRMWTLPLHIG